MLKECEILIANESLKTDIKDLKNLQFIIKTEDVDIIRDLKDFAVKMYKSEYKNKKIAEEKIVFVLDKINSNTETTISLIKLKKNNTPILTQKDVIDIFSDSEISNFPLEDSHKMESVVRTTYEKYGSEYISLQMIEFV